MGSEYQSKSRSWQMILLDTHVLLWLRTGEESLGSVARTEINQAWQSGDIAVSSISFWEIAILKIKSRIKLQENIENWRRVQLEQGIVEIPVDGNIGLRASSLIDFHANSADRFIVATALMGHRLVTADKGILDWSGELDRLAVFE